MRVRVRGPNGQSVIIVEDTSTVGSFLETIAHETSLSSFDVKYGYPPKVLDLHRYPASTPLCAIDVKLNGEQLIVSHRENPLVNDAVNPNQPASSERMNKAIATGSAQALRETIRNASTENVVSSTGSGFSFGNLGTAPPAQPVSAKVPKTKAKAPAAPLSLQRKDYSETMSDPPEIVLPEQGGTLVLRIMPDDNSCLFRAIATAAMPGLDAMNELRSVVAQTIQNNPEKYSKVVLEDKEPDDYCRWIQTEAAWGGQIELDILSKHLDVEICSIDVQSGRVDKYNDEMSLRCILVYSGIHYDTIALSPFETPPEEDIKIFNSADDNILEQAVMLCGRLRDQHYYTDTAGFKVKCQDCGTVVMGETAAQEHASITGHWNFGEMK